MSSTEFPLISHIDDVLPAIEGREEFRVMDKGDYKVIDYVYQSHTTFADEDPRKVALLRECRGLIFNRHGQLIRRAFHKFFNLSEKPEHTQINVNLDDYYLTNKYDGSMVTPLFCEGKFNLATRAGVTEHSQRAMEFIKDKPHYEEFMYDCVVRRNHIPIFEYLDPKNPIVLKYGHEDLVLLKVRDLMTGRYFDLYPSNITCSRPLELGVNLKELVEIASKQEDLEGWVLYHKKTHSPTIKVKLDWYCQIHRAKDKINTPNAVIELAMMNQLDDIKPFLTGTMLQYVNDLETAFFEWYYKVKPILRAKKKHMDSYCETRKDYALEIMKLDRYSKAILFRVLDGDDLTETLNKVIMGNLHPNSKFEEFSKEFMRLENLRSS